MPCGAGRHLQEYRHERRQHLPQRQQRRGHLQPRDPGAEGRFLQCAGRQHRLPARRQRRRQDDHAARRQQPAAWRARRGHQGLDRAQGRAGRGPDAGRPGQARRHPGDGGAPLLRPPDHRGKPDDRCLYPPATARVRRRCHPREGLHLFPAPEDAAHQPGCVHLGRRAADVRHRPGADGRSEDGPARRTLDGPRPADRRRGLRPSSRTSTSARR